MTTYHGCLSVVLNPSASQTMNCWPRFTSLLYRTKRVVLNFPASLFTQLLPLHGLAVAGLAAAFSAFFSGSFSTSACTVFSFHSRICLSLRSWLRSFSLSTFCTGVLASIEEQAAVAALWLVIMKTGSMRMLLKAVWLAERANVTKRFSHSSCLGTMAP